MRGTRGVQGLALALAAAAGLPAHAAAIAWQFYPASCAGGSGAVEIACGDYGRFLIEPSQVPPPACAEAGMETPPGYPVLKVVHAFPAPVPRLAEVAPVPAGLTAMEKWIAVLDWDDPHGESTTWLAGKVAGEGVAAVLVPLDATELEGPVGDFHVLAKLCEIAQVVDAGDLPVPVTVNMSFGRAFRPLLDPTSPPHCPAQNVACHIGRVVQHLHDQGARFVAAAGNHGQLLFPAVLDEVVSAGMLDLTAFLSRAPARPAWETPPAAEAWMPGHALCLGSWAAPAGSSYSSALLAGWLVEVLAHPAAVEALSEGTWQPAWHPTRGCFVLSRGSRLTPWCNVAITELFDGLMGGFAEGCWEATPAATVSTPAPGRATVPAPLQSLDTWGAPTHPAPESDPCVPCTAVLLDTIPADLEIDLSESGALPPGILLDELSLRVDGSYYVLQLDPGEVEAIEEGTLATLLVPGGGALLTPEATVSLWYRFKDSPQVSCATSIWSCFWSSTPLLLDLKK